jgi:hypothetical protein
MATPAPQVPSWMKNQPDEAEYLQAMIDGDNATIAAFDAIYNQPFVGPVGPATTGDTTPTPTRQKEQKRDPFSTFSQAGEEQRQKKVEEGFGKGFETEQELTAFTFVDPAIELPKRVLMMDLNEQEQEQFRQMTEYFINEGKPARDAMYAARNRLRIIKEAQRTAPYPMPIVEEGEAGMRVERMEFQEDRPQGFFDALGRQTLETPQVYQAREDRRQKGAKERQTMETSFRIQADAEAEAKGYAAGTQDYEDYVEPRVIALRRDWLEYKMPQEMISMAREIVRYEQESKMTDIQRPVDPKTGEQAKVFVEVDLMSQAQRDRIIDIANGLMYDYEQGVYPPDWMSDPMGGNDPNYSFAQKTTSERMMEDIFTERTPEGELVETRTAQTLRGIGGLIRPVTEAVTELTTYDVDADGNPIDPNDINYGAWIGQPIYRLQEETGERTDLPRKILEEEGIGGWAARTNESIARGRFMGEDFMDNQGLANAFGDEGAWVFGLGVEMMLPITPFPIVKGTGKVVEAGGKAIKAGKVATPIKATGRALQVAGDPLSSGARFTGGVRAKVAANQLAGEPGPVGKAFRDQIAEEGRSIVGGAVSTEKAMATSAAAERVAAREQVLRDADGVANTAEEVAFLRPTSKWKAPSEIPVPEVARTAQVFDDVMDTIDETAAAIDRVGETVSGVLIPSLRGNFGSRFSYFLGQQMGDDANAFYQGLREGASVSEVNTTNRLAVNYLADPQVKEAIQIAMGAEEVQTLFSELGRERYYFVTPNLIAREEVVRSVLDGEDTAEAIVRGAIPGGTSVAAKRGRPMGLNKQMADNIAVEIAEDGSGVIRVNDSLLGQKTLLETMENGRPRIDKANTPQAPYSPKISRIEDGFEIAFDSVDEMTEYFGYLKGGLFKERLGAFEPLRMSEKGFELAGEPLERRLRTRQIATFFKTAGDVTPFGEPLRKMASAIRKFTGFDPSQVAKQVPLPTLRVLKDIKSELDNIPRAVADDARRIRKENPSFTPEQVLNTALEEASETATRQYLLSAGRSEFRQTAIGKRVLATDAGRREVEQLERVFAGLPDDLGKTREMVINLEIERFLRGEVGNAVKQETVSQMIAKFFGDDGATISKGEYIDIAGEALARQNGNFLDAFKDGVVAVRDRYPVLGRKGFGGKLTGDNFSVYLLTFLGDQKKNNIFLRQFDKFRQANPNLIVRPTAAAADVRRFGPATPLFLEGAGSLPETRAAIVDSLLVEVLRETAEGSTATFQQRWVKAMDELFSTGGIKEGPQNTSLGVVTFVDRSVTNNTVRGVKKKIIELLDGDEARANKAIREFIEETLDEPIGDANTAMVNEMFKNALKKNLMNKKAKGVIETLGLNADTVQQYLRQQGISGSPTADLNFAKPALVSIGEESFFLTDFVGATEIRKLKQMTAAGKLDDAIRFYNTRGQTMSRYLLGSLGRILETGTQNIKGGLLGGTLAPNGRYLGVNTFTAWSIASVTAPQYTASAMLRAFPAVIQQVTKASEKFGVAGTAGAFGAFGAFLDFMGGGGVFTGAAIGIGVGSSMAKVLEITRGKNFRYISAALQEYGEMKPNTVVLTTIDGRPVTAGQIQEMLIRNNIYRSEVSFEYGTQVLQELQRAYRVTARAKGGPVPKSLEPIARFLDGAGGGMAGRKSFWNLMAEESDNAFRTQVFIDSIALGMPEDQAALMAKTVLLDYGAIPSAAKQYLRPLLLFFAFSSQITKEAFLAFLRADSSGASNIARQIRISQEFANKERTDILNQLSNRNLTRLWSYFGDSFDEYHTVHYGLQSPAIEGFYNFVELGLFMNDISPYSFDGEEVKYDGLGLDPERALAFKEKFVLGGNPILKMYATPQRGYEGDPQGFLTAREALAFESAGQMSLAIEMFNLEKIEDPEKLRAGEPTFQGGQYRFKDAAGKNAYIYWKTLTMSMAVDRNITDWGTTTAMENGLSGVELKRFKGEWYLYAVGLDTPIKAPNYLQIQDKMRQQQMKELRSGKK